MANRNPMMSWFQPQTEQPNSMLNSFGRLDGYGQQRAFPSLDPTAVPNLIPGLVPNPIGINPIDNPLGIPGDVPSFVLDPSVVGPGYSGPTIPNSSPDSIGFGGPSFHGWSNPNIPFGADPKKHRFNPENFPLYPAPFGGGGVKIPY